MRARSRRCFTHQTKTKLLTTDILVLATMKNAAKCDTQCELQNSVNHQTFERILRYSVITLACLFQWRLPLSPKGPTRPQLGGQDSSFVTAGFGWLCRSRSRGSLHMCNVLRSTQEQRGSRVRPSDRWVSWVVLSCTTLVWTACWPSREERRLWFGAGTVKQSLALGGGQP